MKRWLLSRSWLWEPILHGEINRDYDEEYNSYHTTYMKSRRYGYSSMMREPRKIYLIQSYRHIIYGTIIGTNNRIIETYYTDDDWAKSSKERLIYNYLEKYDRNRNNSRRKRKANSK